MGEVLAESCEAWLARLPADRVAMICEVRDVVRAAVPDGYVERVSGSMLVWEVPLSRYPDTYNKQPLMLAALAAQKNHNALYLVCAYTDPARDARLRDAYAKAGRKIDMGKSCLRFRKRDGVLYDAVSEIIAETSVDTLIAGYEASRAK